MTRHIKISGWPSEKRNMSRSIFLGLFVTGLLGVATPVYAESEELVRPFLPMELENDNPEVNETVNAVARDLGADRVAKRTNAALDRLIRIAAWRLKKEGHKDLANQIESEWRNEYSRYLTFIFVDLGDHNPLSEWLNEVYQSLRATLGDAVLKRFHLDDIWVINYAIPVVFKPCLPEWDKAEYKLHFVPFAGSVTYWAAYISCTIAVAAMDFAFFCSPVGSFAEMGMVTLIAPGLSDGIYQRRCE